MKAKKEGSSSSRTTASVIKIICVSLILIFLSGIGVMAVTTQISNVKITLANGYEMTVLTSKTNVSDILEENNIVLAEDETVIPDINEELTEGKTIEITNKSTQEIQIAKISEEGVEVSLDELLESYAPITEKIVVEQVAIPYETVTKDVSSGATDTKNKVVQAGQDGLKEVTYKIKYQNDIEIERTVLSEVVITEPVDKIVQVQQNTTSRSSTTSRSETSTTTTSTTGTKAEYQAYAKQLCESYGWTDYDYNCLVSLWDKESGWNPYAYNSSSGAYGIPQALPATKMASAGIDYLTNYKTQISWGLSYIKSRYGSPSVAWEHSKTNGWY